MLGVTIDSNVYISALNFGGLCARLLSLGRYHLYRIDTTNDILDEVFVTSLAGSRTGFTPRG